jgi:hypothetical protein
MAMTAKRHTLDAYVLDTLMRDLVGHDHRPSALLVYLAVSAAQADGRAILSHAALAERTGLSRRSVQDAVAHLIRRGLLRSLRGGPTDTSEYQALTPWRR